MRSRGGPLLAFVFGLVLLLPAVTGCGGGPGGQAGQGSRVNSAERAFLEAMVPHHQAAVEMAEVAGKQAKAPQIKRLAGQILAAQKAEITQMGRIHRRLLGGELRPDEHAHGALGLSAEEAGMNHMDAAADLKEDRPFERAFVDEMVPHHEGAIRMAEALLARGRDPELRNLAEDIIAAQRQEIAEMSAFRQARYGKARPEKGGRAGQAMPKGAGHGGH